MRLTRAAACRSVVGCFFALMLTAPAAAQPATVIALAAQQKDLTTFVVAIHKAGLDDTFAGPGPYTIFAPTDEAFAKMPAADRDALLASPERLKALILGHTVKDMIKMRDGDSTISSGSVTSVGGREIQFGMRGDAQTVDGAQIVRADLLAGNGSVTKIDKVPLT